MRITKISVKGLFGMFDHEIPLNQESRITIIHGPNGVGKTVLMRMADGLLKSDFELHGRIPFEKLRVDFEDGQSITAQKQIMDNMYLYYDDETGFNFTPFAPVMLDNERLISLIEEVFEEVLALIKIGRRPYWFIKDEARYLMEVGDDYSLRNFMDRGAFFHFYYSNLRDDPDAFSHMSDERLPFSPMPDWYGRVSLMTRIHLMDTNRLLSDTYDVPLVYTYFEEFMDEHIDVARPELAALDLSRRINANYKYYQENYPECVSLFREIINERFLFKSFSSYHDSFVLVVDDDGSPVPWTALSSGEQHLVVLYYQLLFVVQPDTLVMIDEPELSMNVVWQRNFLKDLQRIIELRNFDVLIATHSPQIIHDKWDWMVPLGENIDGEEAV